MDLPLQIIDGLLKLLLNIINSGHGVAGWQAEDGLL